MSELLEKEWIFSRAIAELILYAYASDKAWGVSMGETWRPPEMAEIYAKQGKGVKHSTHTERLGADILLWNRVDKRISNEIEDYRPLGEWWKRHSLGPIKFRWGGDFKRVDVYHFSIEHNGVQ